MRTLIGLALGLLLFFVGIPALVAAVHRFGVYDPFDYQQAMLAVIMVLACVIAVQLTGLRNPPNPPKGKE